MPTSDSDTKQREIYYYYEGGDVPHDVIHVIVNGQVKAIEDDEAFWYCTSLVSIRLPDGLKSIGDNALTE